MAKKSKHLKKHLLSHTRPPSIRKPSPVLKSRTTRSLIRTHHTLTKRLNRALSSNDSILASDLQRQIDANGGLELYQKASIQGQSASRGGDSSKVLIQWMNEFLAQRTGINDDTAGMGSRNEKGAKRLRMLEVGALKVDNACAKSGLFDMERIDLQSQHPDILQQDFMARPIPDIAEIPSHGFDVVSLSLVLNYVGDPAGRGEMLKRVASFLRRRDGEVMFPGLFLVLPAPCVTNSRYLDEERLSEIMQALGYEMARGKLSSKLVYYYWVFKGYEKAQEATKKVKYEKRELRKGNSRNNFAITVQ